jgi:CheY-like chemotaxis protein
MTPHPTGTILLIDDEPSFVRALARLLHRDGYRVDTAAEGQQALAQLQTQHYDVILCDLRMPGLDGFTFYTRLQQQAPVLCHRVIFITGDTLGAESTVFLAQCGQPVLTKPCSAATVRHTIQQVLGTGGGDPATERGKGGTVSRVNKGRCSQAEAVSFSRRNTYPRTAVVPPSSP